MTTNQLPPRCNFFDDNGSQVHPIGIIDTREIIEGIEYKLFNNDKGPAVRVMDIEVAMSSAKDDGVVTVINYPNAEMAQDAYRTATAAAWQCAASNQIPVGG
jgi:hypothetical protein